MQYILRIGPWHVGPFATHRGAQHFAESHGCDDYTLIRPKRPAGSTGCGWLSCGIRCANKSPG
jgi:hypothetical protein